MKAFLALLLFGCTSYDAAQWRCEATLLCDGGVWQVTPSVVCAFDHADAVERYSEFLDALVSQTKCVEYTFSYACTSREIGCDL